MKHRYKISEVISPRGVCHLSSIDNVDDWARMHQNEPQAGRFPKDASFQMSSDFPRDVKLADALANLNGFLVVSEKFASFLSTEKALAHNEVHEVGIVNHKGRREKARYFIIHQIDDPKCVDEGKTVGKKSTLMPAEFSTLKKLVLDEKKVGRDYMIFRPFEYKLRVFFRDDLVEKIEAAGFTGIEFFDLEGYTDY
jgi:hypothetical protein